MLGELWMAKRVNERERIRALEKDVESSKEDRSNIKADIKDTKKQYSELFSDINNKLNTVNTEQGQTRDAVVSLQTIVEKQGETLQKLILQRVSAPMSGRDKAILYGTAVTAFFTFLGVVLPAIINAFTPP